MVVRAFHLGAINYNQYTYLIKKMNQKNMRKKELLDDVLNVPQPMLIGKAVGILLKTNVLKPKDIIEEDSLCLHRKLSSICLIFKKGTLSEEKKDDMEVLLQFRN